MFTRLFDHLCWADRKVLESLRSAQNPPGKAAFATIAKALTPDSLAGEISYRNSAGASFTSTLEDILTHVALHGSYHRGQIAASLRAADETPSPTDYIAFARGSPAATRTIG